MRFRASPSTGEAKGATGLCWDAELREAPAPKERLVVGEPVEGTSYKIIRWLGDGGMGVVYEAEHVELGRRVALKVMHPGIAGSKAASELFRGEARRASRIGSDNIVEVFDFAELSDGELIFTMELLEGTTLDSEISREPIGPARTIGILRQLCRGLAAAHAAGIVHRDVKPENVALQPWRGRDDMVKILDFGISTMLGSNAGTQAVGSPPYMAPEVFMGCKTDTSIDMYGVGCTAYEMLTGRTPFVHEDVKEMLRAHFEIPAVAPSVVRPDLSIPPALDAVILRCLEKDAAHRFRDMADLEAALCEAQVEAGLFTGWDDLPLPHVDITRRDRLLGTMPEPEVKGPPSGRRWLGTLAAVLIAAISGLGGYIYGASRGIESASSAGDPIEALARQAEAAAARGGYVFPTPGIVDDELADHYLNELEAMRGPDAARAREVAGDLRRSMAGALIDVGDELWAQEGARRFAVRYYEEALIFGASDSVTYARASRGADEAALAALSESADDGPEELDAIDEAEWMRVEPMLIAAGPDRAQRRSTWAKATSKRRRQRAKSKTLGDEGAAALRRGDPKKAEPLLRRALALDPKNSKTHSSISELLFVRGDTSSALKHARRMVDLSPRNSGYRVRLGDIFAHLGKLNSAKAEYRVAINLGHSSAIGSLKALERRTR